MARTKRLRGFNVLHPFGWDAFGLPAENAAIKTGTPPETSTFDNIAHMKGQLQRLGVSYAWEREIATCLPEYYKFNQWIFLKMFERGLAYRKRSTVNWCPSCQTVLANEQVVEGACWRCGTVVVTRDLEQWFFRITAYADELLQGLETLTDWPEKVVVMQRNWIGRSEGARVRFPIVDRRRRDRGLHHAHRHDLRRDLRAARPRASAGGAVCGRESGSGGVPRRAGEVPRAGPRRPADAEKKASTPAARRVNPFTGEDVPIWIANFVLAEYGTGAIMAVPAHDQRDFEFARKYHLPIRVVVQSGDQPVSADDDGRRRRPTTGAWSTRANTTARKRRRSWRG